MVVTLGTCAVVLNPSVIVPQAALVWFQTHFLQLTSSILLLYYVGVIMHSKTSLSSVSHSVPLLFMLHVQHTHTHTEQVQTIVQVEVTFTVPAEPSPHHLLQEASCSVPCASWSSWQPSPFHALFWTKLPVWKPQAAAHNHRLIYILNYAIIYYLVQPYNLYSSFNNGLCLKVE